MQHAQDHDAESPRQHISPITRLNSDELMIIFELSGEVHWTAPLSISGVCREWRSIILATPRAWANLHLPEEVPFNLISLYVARSQPLLLHLSTVGAASCLGAQLDSFLPCIQVTNDIAQRIECLTILFIELPFLTGQFLCLRRLHLSGRRPMKSGEMYDVDFSMFPGLRHLYLEDVRAPSTRSYSALTFPKIQQLALRTDHRHKYYGFIRLIAKDLVSLHLRVPIASQSTIVKSLYLPVLRYLHLVNAGCNEWEFAANTPALISYIPIRAFTAWRWSWQHEPQVSVSVDTAQVTHLRLLDDLDLTPYTNLRYLQIRFPPENIIERLEHNQNLCHDLETIESLIDCRKPSTSTKIDRETLGVTKQIRIIKTGSWDLEFPFHMTREVSSFTSLQECVC